MADILTGDLHEVVDVGHGLAVVDGGGGLGAVQVADVADPLVHGGRVLPSHTLDAPGPEVRTYILFHVVTLLCVLNFSIYPIIPLIGIQISSTSSA